MRDLRYGDRRDDGAVFVGWHTRGDKKYEHWMSEESWRRKSLKNSAKTNAKFKERKATDPVFAKLVREKACKDMQNYRRVSPEKNMYYRARTRAKKLGVAFDIDLSDIEVPVSCPILGIPFTIGEGNFDNSPSLDRIDNTKGYIKGNVVVISLRANRIKRDATVEELIKVSDFYARLSPA